MYGLSPSLNDSCHKLSTFISSFRAGIIFFMGILEFKYVHKSKYWNFIVKMQDKRQRNKLLLLANHAKTMNLDIIGWKNVTIVEYDLREESSWIMTPWLLYFKCHILESIYRKLFLFQKKYIESINWGIWLNAQILPILLWKCHHYLLPNKTSVIKSHILDMLVSQYLLW